MQVNQWKEKFQNTTLLYVEDDALVRQQINEFLQRYIPTVVSVSSAEEALDVYISMLPDIMLLDVNLPGMNGLTLAQKIRQQDRDVRIIISTAYTDKEFLLHAIELELTRYLVKPVVGADLLEAIDKAVAERIMRAHTTNTAYIILEKGYSYDMHRHVLMYQEMDIKLRRKEMILLEYFMTHPNQIIRYEILEYDVWSDSAMSRDAIRAQIRNVRKKTYSDIIENISAIGYKLTLKALL